MGNGDARIRGCAGGLLKESPTPPRTFLERIIIGGNRRSCPVPAFACVPAWRRGLSLPLWCPRGACLVGRLPPLPLALFLPPSPRPPSRREGGDQGFFSCKGLRPLHPRGCTHGSPRKRQEAVPYKQCRQPRRGGTGGEELRRLRWSSPPGQGEQVPHRVQPPLRAPQRQGQPVPPGAEPPPAPPLPSFPFPQQSPHKENHAVDERREENRQNNMRENTEPEKADRRNRTRRESRGKHAE